MWRPPSSLASAAGPTSGAVVRTRPERGSARSVVHRGGAPRIRGHLEHTRSIRRVILVGAPRLVKPLDLSRRPNRPSPPERVIDTVLPGVTSGGRAGVPGRSAVHSTRPRSAVRISPPGPPNGRWYGHGAARPCGPRSEVL